MTNCEHEPYFSIEIDEINEANIWRRKREPLNPYICIKCGKPVTNNIKSVVENGHITLTKLKPVETDIFGNIL